MPQPETSIYLPMVRRHIEAGPTAIYTSAIRVSFAVARALNPPTHQHGLALEERRCGVPPDQGPAVTVAEADTLVNARKAFQ